jgi:sugar (pentulose or hexulose) kinase
VISAIGLGQVLAWGSTYYLPAVLAVPIAEETGWSLSWLFGALSVGDPIYRLRVMAALDLPGVTAVTTLTIDGSSAASVAPATSADVLVTSTITVTVA